MGDRSLRDALEKLAADWRSVPHDPESVATTVMRHCGAQVASALADHPAEPAPDRQPSDAAVEAAARDTFERKYGLGWDAKWIDEGRRKRAKAEIIADVSTALEAAYRVDAPRPLLDRAAVSRRLTEIIDRSMETGALPRNDLLDAVMELARPMPTREQIAEALHDEDNAHSWRSLGICSDWCYDLYLKHAGAVLALLNGAE